MDDLRKTFRQELDDIRTQVVGLGTSVIEAIPRATAVLLEGDLEGADYLVQADDEIDARAIDIEDSCFSNSRCSHLSLATCASSFPLSKFLES